MSDTNSTEKKPNWFVRILIIGFSLLLVAMIGYNYIAVIPKGEINSGILTLLSILIVLVLSESFDNFSVGKLISISREVKKKDKEITKLDKEKTDLLNQLITISSTQNQTQQHTNVYGDYHAGKVPVVEKATEQELEAKESEDNQKTTETSNAKDYRLSMREVEELALNKYVSKKNIHKSNVISEAKLVTQFHGVDPVSNAQPIYDAYYKTEDNNEVFVEFKVNKGIHVMLRDRLYLMLSKLNHYQNVKKVNVHLDLVWLNLPNDSSNTRNFDRIMSDFEPAISSGLLRISEIDFTQEEIDNCTHER